MIDYLRHKEGKGLMILHMFIFAILLFAFFAFYGCESKPPLSQAKRAVRSPAQTSPVNAVPPIPIEELQEPDQKGYIYDQRGRRDPFVPLIIRKASLPKKKNAKLGTIESYDLTEFSLAAIITKAGRNFALIVTPDNRSFTVSEGDVIGLNNGMVKEITDNRIVMVEYSKDYRGNLKPREIILEFHKGD